MKKLGKLLSFAAFAAALAVAFVGSAAVANADTYPRAIAEDDYQECYAGDVVKLRYTINPVYEYERIVISIDGPDGFWACSDDTYDFDAKNYDWDTHYYTLNFHTHVGDDIGYYTVTAKMYYYYTSGSFGMWKQAPYSTITQFRLWSSPTGKIVSAKNISGKKIKVKLGSVYDATKYQVRIGTKIYTWPAPKS